MNPKSIWNSFPAHSNQLRQLVDKRAINVVQFNVTDSLFKGLDMPTDITDIPRQDTGLLLVLGSNFGWMSFLPSPVTHVGTSSEPGSQGASPSRAFTNAPRLL